MTYRVTIQPNELSFSCDKGQSIAEAAQQSGVRIPVSCKNGVCHICRAELLSGVVVMPTGIEATADKASEIFVCHAQPNTDIEIRMSGVFGPKQLPMNQTICQIKSVEALQAHVYRVVLEQSAGKLVEFFSGQYLALDLPHRDEDSFFSIASSPGKREIELHIQADPHLEKALQTIEFLKASSSVKVKLPFGKACLNGVPDTGVLLLAAGTGYAQMKSLIEFLLEHGFEQELTLYWTARKHSDLYALEALEALSNKHTNFKFLSIVADSTEDVQTTEHHSLLADAVLAGHEDLSDYQVFVAGSPKLVYSTLDVLEAAGLKEDAFFSDVLEYVSRDQV